MKLAGTNTVMGKTRCMERWHKFTYRFERAEWCKTNVAATIPW